MLLLIDVGNTNIVFGVYKDNKQVGSFRLTSNVTRTSDELGLNACAYFQRFGLNPCQVRCHHLLRGAWHHARIDQCHHQVLRPSAPGGQ